MAELISMFPSAMALVAVFVAMALVVVAVALFGDQIFG
jgi:hypothetical protein